MSEPYWEPFAKPGAAVSGLVPIQRIALAADTANFDFQNIPAYFAHLKIIVAARSSFAATGDQMGIRLNNDSAANYAWQRLYGQAAAAPNTAENAGDTKWLAGWFPGSTGAAGHVNSQEILLPNYAGTTMKKSFSSFSAMGGNAGQMFVALYGGYWNNTGAVNRVTVYPASGGNWVTGSVATLYGLLDAPVAFDGSAGAILAWKQRTDINAGLAITATAFPGTKLLETAAIVCDGGLLEIEGFCMRASPGTSWVELSLGIDGVQQGVGGYGTNVLSIVDFKRLLAPAPGSHTFALHARVDAGSGTVFGGTGTAGQHQPMFLSVRRPNVLPGAFS